MIRYFSFMLGLTLVLAGSYLMLSGQMSDKWLHPWFPTMLGFYFLQSLMVMGFFHFSERNHWQSPIYTLLAIGFRLLTAMGFILLIFIVKPVFWKYLMAQFSALYLLYLTFELFVLFPNLRRN